MVAPNSQNTTADTSAKQDGGMTEGQITDELVKQIADKVYAMLLLEMKIARERCRPLTHKSFSDLGGRYGC